MSALLEDVRFPLTYAAPEAAVREAFDLAVVELRCAEAQFVTRERALTRPKEVTLPPHDMAVLKQRLAERHKTISHEELVARLLGAVKAEGKATTT